MAGNTFGELFKVTTFGESHGPAMGCVIDGCPAGLELSADDRGRELQRRRPGQGAYSTSRSETDEPEILSGLFENKTLGTPIAILVRNSDCRPLDYENLRDIYRPGHADFGWQAKYGIRDHRGGGRSSGRETVCRVAAGAVAKKFLASYSISITAWASAIAGLELPKPGDADFIFDEIEKNPLRAGGRAAAEKALKIIEKIRSEGDSAGGIVTCRVHGVPPGIGEPVFAKFDARLAEAMLSIGAARGIEFGAGFAAAGLKGSENNNIAEGIIGGISTGQDIEFKVAFRPIPSIEKIQKALNSAGSIVGLAITGRHDACVIPRVIPAVEAMTALVLADLVLLQRCAR
jgi:chorismate synthase